MIKVMEGEPSVDPVQTMFFIQSTDKAWVGPSPAPAGSLPRSTTWSTLGLHLVHNILHHMVFKLRSTIQS